MKYVSTISNTHIVYKITCLYLLIGLISMSSFNKQNKPIFGNVLAIATVDAVTSIICGTTVFSVLGYIAKSQSKDIEDIIEQGPGLVFMVYSFDFVLFNINAEFKLLTHKFGVKFERIIVQIHLI